MHCTVCLYFSRALPFQSELNLHKYTSLMPAPVNNTMSRYRRWQDRQLHLFGRLLLMEGMKNLGYTGPVLEDIEFTEFKKPYFRSLPVSFSISHSGGMVLCALSPDARVGADIEKIEKLDIHDFRDMFSTSEWHTIQSAPDSMVVFYQYWTEKEAAIKANGKGWHISPTAVRLSPGEAVVEEKKWITHPVTFFNGFSGCIASDKEINGPLMPQQIFY
jgi:4'-phosphopantetheinyl transferase